MKMKRSFKIITIVALFLSLILISSCSTENHKEEDVREANTQLKLESEELNGITIELLLREFANWDGNKELTAYIPYPSRDHRPNGTPEGTRTPDTRFRKPLLCPPELRAPDVIFYINDYF
jgi:hypothetical protein